MATWQHAPLPQQCQSPRRLQWQIVLLLQKARHLKRLQRQVLQWLWLRVLCQLWSRSGPLQQRRALHRRASVLLAVAGHARQLVARMATLLAVAIGVRSATVKESSAVGRAAEVAEGAVEAISAAAVAAVKLEVVTVTVLPARGTMKVVASAERASVIVKAAAAVVTADVAAVQGLSTSVSMGSPVERAVTASAVAARSPCTLTGRAAVAGMIAIAAGEAVASAVAE